jgi:hypothetical protein
VQQLSASDEEVRLKLFHQLVELLTGDPSLLQLMTDETHFHLNELNKQNFSYWSHHKPHELHEHSLHDP